MIDIGRLQELHLTQTKLDFYEDTPLDVIQAIELSNQEHNRHGFQWTNRVRVSLYRINRNGPGNRRIVEVTQTGCIYLHSGPGWVIARIKEHPNNHGRSFMPKNVREITDARSGRHIAGQDIIKDKRLLNRSLKAAGYPQLHSIDRERRRRKKAAEDKRRTKADVIASYQAGNRLSRRINLERKVGEREAQLSDGPATLGGCDQETSGQCVEGRQ